jgi:hypothetical protein
MSGAWWFRKTRIEIFFFTLGGAIAPALQLNPNYGSCRGRNPESALYGRTHEIYKGLLRSQPEAKTYGAMAILDRRLLQ